MSQNRLKYKQKHPRTFTGKTCSPLLCYRFVSTSLTMQIPSGNAIAKPPAFSYSPLLHYRKAYRANSYGNAIAKPPALLHSPLLYYTTLATQISSGNAIAKTT